MSEGRRLLGMAYQLVDDVLDLAGDDQALAALSSVPMDASRAVFEGLTELSLERGA